MEENVVINPTDTTNVTSVAHVRGWLLFLCISLVVLRGLGFLGALAAAIATSETRALMFLYAISFAYGISTGIILWSRRPWAVIFAKLYFILQPYLTAGIWLIYLGFDSSAGGQAVVAIFQTLIGSFLWFPYLTFSKRVKATYNIVNPNRRSPLLAFFMGAALGPLAAIYFNIRVFLMSILAFLLAIILAVLVGRILNLTLPPWMGYIWLVYYAIVNLVIAYQWNDAIEYPDAEETPWSTAAQFGTIMGIWAFRIIGTCTGIYGGIELFKEHRIFLGILFLILTPSLMSWVAGWMMRVIMFMVALISGIKTGKA